MQNLESERIDNAELKEFIQAHVPEARLKEAQGGDVVYSLPPFTSSTASSYRSLLTALDSNLDTLQLGGYGISDTTLEEVSSYTPTHKNTGLHRRHSGGKKTHAKKKKNRHNCCGTFKYSLYKKRELQLRLCS